jgi:hypothetical protein
MSANVRSCLTDGETVGVGTGYLNAGHVVQFYGRDEELADRVAGHRDAFAAVCRLHREVTGLAQPARAVRAFAFSRDELRR